MLYQSGYCQAGRSRYKCQVRIPSSWRTANIITLSTHRLGAHRSDPLYLLQVGSLAGWLYTQIGTTIFSEKGAERQQVQRLCVIWSPMARILPDGLCRVMDFTHPSSTVKISFPSINRGRWYSNGGDGRCHVIHILKQHKEFHWVPRRGEIFLLTGKKNLGLKNSIVPSFHVGQCFRPRILAGLI